MTAAEIVDSGVGTNRVIYHFGEGIYGVGVDAEANNIVGVPTLAIPGGPEGQVAVYVDGDFKKAFPQSALDRGVVNAGAQRIYHLVMARKRPTDE